jgi:hypothetical protein
MKLDSFERSVNSEGMQLGLHSCKGNVSFSRFHNANTLDVARIKKRPERHKEHLSVHP